VIMCDDGSTDDTKALAEAVMASFGHATGVVIQGTHAAARRRERERLRRGSETRSGQPLG